MAGTQQPPDTAIAALVLWLLASFSWPALYTWKKMKFSKDIWSLLCYWTHHFVNFHFPLFVFTHRNAIDFYGLSLLPRDLAEVTWGISVHTNDVIHDQLSFTSLPCTCFPSLTLPAKYRRTRSSRRSDSSHPCLIPDPRRSFQYFTN